MYHDTCECGALLLEAADCLVLTLLVSPALTMLACYNSILAACSDSGMVDLPAVGCLMGLQHISTLPVSSWRACPNQPLSQVAQEGLGASLTFQ